MKALQSSTSVRGTAENGKSKAVEETIEGISSKYQLTSEIMEDDCSPVLEQAEIATAFRLSPQRPKAITSIRIQGRDSGIGSPTSIGTPWGSQSESPPNRSRNSTHLEATESSSIPIQYNNFSASPTKIAKNRLSLDSAFEKRNSIRNSLILQPGSLEILELKAACHSLDIQNSGATEMKRISLIAGEPSGQSHASKEDESAPTTPLASATRQDSNLKSHRKIPSGIKHEIIPNEHNESVGNIRKSGEAVPRSRESEEKARIVAKKKERERDKKAEEKKVLQKNGQKPPLRLLSLDGGGFRGYTMILILEDLMYQTFIATHGRAPDPRKGEYPPKPCEVFDIIGGTGIGGIIAIFLGRLRLSIGELKEIYPQVMESILQREKRVLGIPYRSTLFRSTNLVETLRQVICHVTKSRQTELPRDPFDSDEEQQKDDAKSSPAQRTGIARSVSKAASTSAEMTSPISPGFKISTTRRRAGSLPSGRASMDDGYLSDTKSLSSRSLRAKKRLLKMGVGRKKSLNDLGSNDSPEEDLQYIPPVPKVDPKYLSTPAGESVRSGDEGNADEILYDVRNGSCRTFVTATLKGAFMDQDPALLRTYNSPAEAPIEPTCTIWQACAATMAINMMFKPVQIGQHIFIDEGQGEYNPAPSVLKETAFHLWPGREIGCFVSIGTGKRASAVSTPTESASWWEGAIGGALGAFALSKRRLAQKVDACELTHEAMKNYELQRSGVLDDDYFRFNADLGWTEYDLNEWENLGDMNTLAKRYLGRSDVHEAVRQCGRRMGAVHRAREKQLKVRYSTPKVTTNTGSQGQYLKSAQQTRPNSSIEPVTKTISPMVYSELDASEPASPRDKGRTRISLENQSKKRETFYIYADTPAVPMNSPEVEFNNPLDNNKGSLAGSGFTTHILPSVPELSTTIMA